MKTIPLTQGQFAIVDAENYEELSKHKWYAHKTRDGGYVAIRHLLGQNYRLILMHRIIMACPKGMQVDHRNHNKLDNRNLNLRICNNAQNMRNGLSHKDGSSKYKGVCWFKRSRKWMARIGLNYKDIHLGYFDSEKQAAQAYDKAARKYFGEFACCNFPLSVERKTL